MDKGDFIPKSYTHFAVWHLKLEDGYHRIQATAKRRMIYNLKVELDGNVIEEKKGHWTFRLNGEYRFRVSSHEATLHVNWHLLKTLGRYSFRLFLDGKRLPINESDAPKWILKIIGDGPIR